MFLKYCMKCKDILYVIMCKNMYKKKNSWFFLLLELEIKKWKGFIIIIIVLISIFFLILYLMLNIYFLIIFCSMILNYRVYFKVIFLRENYRVYLKVIFLREKNIWKRKLYWEKKF